MSEELVAKEQVEVSKSVVNFKHPLLQFVPTDLKAFEEWLDKWDTTNLAIKLGLLHSLTMEDGWWPQEPKLISLLLEVADGHASEHNFVIADEFDYNRHKARNRRLIARKAFSVLCLKFFKDAKESWEKPLWWWILQNEELFQKVLWFLGRRENQYCLSCRDFSSSDPSTHQQGVFRTFVQKFAQLGWEFKSVDNRCWDSGVNDSVRKRLITARPQFIDLLCALRELDWLEGKELDSASLNRLTEMANENVYLPPVKVCASHSFRKPISLEEAVFGGSIPARILLLYRVYKKEQKRIDALYKESARQQREIVRQQELAKVEAQRKALDSRVKELASASSKR